MKSETEWKFLAYVIKVGVFKKPKEQTNSIDLIRAKGFRVYLLALMQEPIFRLKKRFGRSAKLALMHKVVLKNKWILKPIIWTVTNHSLTTKIYTTQ